MGEGIEGGHPGVEVAEENREQQLMGKLFDAQTDFLDVLGKFQDDPLSESQETSELGSKVIEAMQKLTTSILRDAGISETDWSTYLDARVSAK